MSEKKVVEEALQPYLDRIREELKNGEGKELYKLFTSSHYENFYYSYAWTPKALSITGIEFILAKIEKEEELIGIPQEIDEKTKLQLIAVYKRKIIPYKKTDLEDITLTVRHLSLTPTPPEVLKSMEAALGRYIIEEKYEVIKDEEDIEDLIKIVKAILTGDIDEIYYSELYFDLVDKKRIKYDDETFEYIFYKHKKEEKRRAIKLYYKQYEGNELKKEGRIYIQDFSLVYVDLAEIQKKLEKLKSIMEDNTRIVQERIEKYFDTWEREPREVIYELKDNGEELIFTMRMKEEEEFKMVIPKYIRIDRITYILGVILHCDLETEEKIRNIRGREIQNLIPEEADC